MARSSNRQDEMEAVAESVGRHLEAAVRETLTQHSPEPARTAVGQLTAVDGDAVGGDEPGPAQTLALLTLVRWLTVVRTELADRPQRVDEVLAWIEECLGRRYAARARYTVGPLRSAEASDEILHYATALGADFLPSLVWLVAGAAAVYGDGDAGWPGRLEHAGGG